MRPAYSPDGTRIAAGFEDDTAKVWDAASGKELLVLRGHTGRINWLAFSPDGTRVATTGSDGTAKIWDIATGNILLSLPVEGGEQWLSLSVRMGNILPWEPGQEYRFLSSQSKIWWH
jgi:WD40 repeat protein